jgi:uncharacterized membrane protein
MPTYPHTSTGAAASNRMRAVASVDPSAAPPLPNRRGMARARSARVLASREERLADALGWFSIGLGLVELLAPRALGRAIGIAANPGMVRVLGLREIVNGIGILTQSPRSEWLWARVAGDGIDAAALAFAGARPDARRGRVVAAGAAVAGMTVLDVMASQRCGEREARGETDALTTPVRVEHAIGINRPVEECFRYWRDFQNLPRFMKNLKSVEMLDARRSRWVATGPVGLSVEWDAEIVAEEPNRFISWRTLPGADVAHSGSVHFAPAPGGRGSLVHASMEFDIPGRRLGTLFARLFGADPRQQAKEDMRRFKQLLETGEIPTTVGQPSGRRSAVTRLLVRKGLPG